MDFFQSRPRIETERLVLRRWNKNDMEGFLRFAADPEIMLAAGAKAVSGEKEARAELNRAIDDPYVLAITLKSTGEVLGKIKYQNDLLRHGTNAVSIGYELSKPYWGNGYMTEALRAMVRHAFLSMGMDVVGISHFVQNERSARVIRRAGFHLDGVIPCAYRRHDGAVFDNVCYSILKEEFFSKKMIQERRIP